MRFLEKIRDRIQGKPARVKRGQRTGLSLGIIS